jgi:cellobiose phosphorylase
MKIYKNVKMATFVPTLSITANGSSHTTPGPFSFALSLTKTDTITVNGKTTSESGALITTTHTDNKIFDQSAMGHAYIYISNPSDREIFLCSDDAGTVGNRFMSVGPGEFAYFPWSGTRDIFADHTGSGTKKLEYFIFEKV